MNKTQEEALICVILMPVVALVCGALGVGLAYVKMEIPTAESAVKAV